ncbi:MAG: hypothetical protein K2X87_15540 [Gemmataceae bacterium]|nr:hypothetical protein [Gemmataceae bacterium]
MSKITIDGPTLEKLRAAAGETVEMVDEAGNLVGRFVKHTRVTSEMLGDDWPSDEELDRRLREDRRYTVAEVEERIQQLREKYG